MPIRWNTTPERMMAAAAAGLKRGVEKVMEESRTKYCPKDTGHLASTGQVDEPKIEGTKIICTARYTADYAIYVHERNARHSNGTWKYLSTPAYQNAEMVRGEAQAALDAEARGQR